MHSSNTATIIAHDIMTYALAAPLGQILENAGLSSKEIMFDINKDNKGYDVKGMCYGDMYKMGIIDPLKVTKNALKNAVSVATTILSTNAVVTMARSYDSE